MAHPNYRFLVLDSISTLFCLEDENSNSEWNKKVNPFLRDIKALDIACIILHHSGKDGKKGFRGASTIGAMVANVFRLTNHQNIMVDDGEAWPIIEKDKQRKGGYSFKAFGLHFFQTDDETHWEVTKTTSR
jgi:RecA-family ATPase